MVLSLPFANMVVPSPGFGAMGMSHHRGAFNDEESLQTLARAVDIGCTFFDTASVYGAGRNEELIGRFLSESKVDREKLFIGSKCGFDVDFSRRVELGTVNNTAEHINQYIRGSIQRLGTKPDLYYLHRMNLETPLEESIAALNGLKTAGLVKYIGLSECSADTLRKACTIAHIDAVQIEYSPWATDHEDDGVIDAAKELGVTIVAYSPLGRGVLTGAFRDATAFQQPNDNRGSIPKYSKENLEGNLRLVDELSEIADRKGCTPGQLSIAWCAAMGTIPIPGTKRIERLEENFGSRDVELTEADLLQIRKVISENKPRGNRYGSASLAHVGK